jgi:hypothetical protein
MSAVFLHQLRMLSTAIFHGLTQCFLFKHLLVFVVGQNTVLLRVRGFEVIQKGSEVIQKGS